MCVFVCKFYLSVTFAKRGDKGYSYNRDAASFFQLLSQQFLGKLNNERASIQFSEEYHRQECKDPPRVARLMAPPPRGFSAEALFILDEILFVALCSCEEKVCPSANVSRFMYVG